MTKIYTLHLGEDNRSDDLEYLEWFNDVLLSKPCAKRFRGKLDGIYTITDVMSAVFANSDDRQTMRVSNGTYAVTLQIGQWKQYASMILSLFTEENCIQSGFKKSADAPDARELVALD